MNTRSLQGRINKELKAVNPEYQIKNLRALPRGDYWFDLEMSFNPRDMNKINVIFRRFLGVKAPGGKRPVQAKFYLSEGTYQKLRERAAKDGRSQSDVVERALQAVLR